MNEIDQTNDARSMMKSDFKDTKLDKSNELNESMTINEQSRDEYENQLHTMGGTQ